MITSSPNASCRRPAVSTLLGQNLKPHCIASGHAKRTPVARLLARPLLLALVLMAAASARSGVITWGLTNSGTGGNMSVGANWFGGIAPITTDSALILSTNGGFDLTNDVAMPSIQDLTYTLATTNAFSDGQSVVTAVNPGTTLQVLGPDGFVIGRNPGFKENFTYTFVGSGILVSNTSGTARVALNSGLSSGGSSSKNTTINLSGVTNFSADVDLFGGGDSRLAGGITVGDQGIKVTLARTNIILATHHDDFTQIDFTNSIEIGRNDNSNGVNSSYSQNSYFQLGYSNLFLADSIGIGRGYCCSGAGDSIANITGNAGNSSGFNVAFANLGNVSSAKFRNTDGVSRVSLLAINVESGIASTNLSGNRTGANLNLQGGAADMLVDQVWLVRNGTNATTTSSRFMYGGVGFDIGTVDANTVYLGYMAFTNTEACLGYLLVGSNAVMRINKTLILGYTPTNDPTGAFASAENNTLGQVQINSGAGAIGTLYVNSVQVGLGSTNNGITDNGLLVVSNAIASATNALTTLNVGGIGQLTFAVAAGRTNAYVTNLISAAGATINIASAPIVSVATYELIHYLGGVHSSFTVGSLPPGIGNASVNDDGANVTITLSTAKPKNLIWDGAQNSNWDHASTNWYNPAGGTNCAFTDGDQVQFGDSNGIPTTINVTDTVLPGEVGFGMLMTNNVNNFTFNGGGSINNASMFKTGTGSLTIGANTTLNVTANQGTLALSASGTVNNATTASGAVFNNAGLVTLTASCSGYAYNIGVITNMTLNGTALMTNDVAGRVEQNLNMAGTSQLFNLGGFDGIGTTTVPAGGYLYNAGYIAGGTLNVNGTFEDTGTGIYPPNQGPPDNVNSSLALENGLSIAAGGVFIPGGSGIGATTISEYPSGASIPVSGSSPANPLGLLKLNPGSTNIFKINLDSGIHNTVVNSIFLSVGQAQTQPLNNGSTIIITNTGVTQLSVGQSLTLFQNTYGGAIGYTGTNVLTSYPFLVPAQPGAGMVWIRQKLPTTGVLSVANPSVVAGLIQFSNMPAIFGTNLVMNFSWSADYVGGWVQSLSAGLTNGLTATNWVDVNYSYGVNSISVTNNLTGGSPAVFYRFIYP
jgi:hypothetical protein